MGGLLGISHFDSRWLKADVLRGKNLIACLHEI